MFYNFKNNKKRGMKWKLFKFRKFVRIFKSVEYNKLLKDLQ